MQNLDARGTGHQTMGNRSLYLSWCEAKHMDPDDTATATYYEDCWLNTHGVEEHTCYGERDGYCDVCRA